MVPIVMRRNTPFSVYNRVIAMHPLSGTPQMGESLLAFFGVGESRLILSFVEWAGLREPGQIEPVYVRKTE